ncbi:MBL fold metallo-hydrolase [Paenibacillus wynnii]|uniref:MBL fold metallo-hydrolase n=1 Tax=Paenibacillus wynnii TaxID=268407 RepID=UPI0027943538|nr:MBL fold metallo-hydrolase [Paenibacillus wynnii]MDQ0195541.1 L-ascorbate metabolism protein UlaG (beta-lactamase superfamily) [Paenibacillus wynnii]
MKLQLIRHAALWLEYGGITFLIDPMLSEHGENPPIMNTANDRRNPLVSLPGPVDTWLKPDVVLVTHLHQDHWDTAAVSSLSPDIQLLCQTGDQERIASQGFNNITAIDNGLSLGNVSLTRTSGQHGSGEIGQLMGRVSGVVFQAEGEPTLYIAGDTIWCNEVQQALDEYHPEITVVNAGGARFLNGGHITMNEQDVVDLCSYTPETAVVAVHMDAINHCLITRELLHQRLKQEQLLDRVTIPGDGEWFQHK